jgi:hypothetical protein
VNRAIYVGRSEDLARLARGLLAEFQAQRRALRQHRRLRAYLRRQLRELKARHQRELAALGVVLDGWEPRSYPELFEKLREGDCPAPAESPRNRLEPPGPLAGQRPVPGAASDRQLVHP